MGLCRVNDGSMYFIQTHVELYNLVVKRVKICWEGNECSVGEVSIPHLSCLHQAGLARCKTWPLSDSAEVRGIQVQLHTHRAENIYCVYVCTSSLLAASSWAGSL